MHIEFRYIEKLYIYHYLLTSQFLHPLLVLSPGRSSVTHIPCYCYVPRFIIPHSYSSQFLE